MKKTYLGDGLFASFDGYRIWLTAENGIHVMDKVALEPAVYQSLLGWVEQEVKPLYAKAGITSPF